MLPNTVIMQLAKEPCLLANSIVGLRTVALKGSFPT